MKNTYYILEQYSVSTDTRIPERIRVISLDGLEWLTTLPSKELVSVVIQEFEKFCLHYHIDPTNYKYIHPYKSGKKWTQFNFIENIDKEWPPTISLNSITYHRNGKVSLIRIDINPTWCSL